jgi:glyoxylase-like metal-dependent hydrolase (beta-lactamase superfamily II)
LAQQRLNQISHHVHWLSPDSATDRPVVGAVAGARGTLVVDAGNSPAHAQLLLRELAGRGVAPPAFVALTHWHWDHVFGTYVLNLRSSLKRRRHVIIDACRLELVRSR